MHTTEIKVYVTVVGVGPQSDAGVDHGHVVIREGEVQVTAANVEVHRISGYVLEERGGQVDRVELLGPGPDAAAGVLERRVHDGQGDETVVQGVGVHYHIDQELTGGVVTLQHRVGYHQFDVTEGDRQVQEGTDAGSFHALDRNEDVTISQGHRYHIVINAGEYGVGNLEVTQGVRLEVESV